MKPVSVIYECENCGKLFYRNVKEVLRDDVDDCHVIVELANDSEGNVEEFPMCPCLGGDAAYGIEWEDEEDQEN